MKQPPSPQEIQDYLHGLNRLHRSYSGMSAGSVAARQRGLNNYYQWFRERDIALYEDPHDHVWKLNESRESEGSETKP